MGSTSAESLAEAVDRLSRPRLVGRILGMLVELPGIGPGVARAMRAPMRLTRVSAGVTRLHGWLLRKPRGRLRRSWLFAAGQPVISLSTTGRKTGQPRATAVACFTVGDTLCVAGMNLGRTQSPGWTYNLAADPRATIHLAGKKVDVVARRLAGTEAEQAWDRWLELQPSARQFQSIAARDIPIFALDRAPVRG